MKLKTQVILVGLGIALGLAWPAGQSLAGSAPAEIDCKSAAGETLVGTIPADYVEVDLVFDDGKGYSHRWQTEEPIPFHADFAEKVLVLFVPGAPSVKLWALPRTIKIEQARHSADGRFKAKAIVAGLDGEASPRELQLDCKYHYSI